MKLKVINSNSQGNCYILSNSTETLILEAGVTIERIKQAINHNFTNVLGCLVTHCHNDHSEAMQGLLKLTVPVFSSIKTFETKGISLTPITNCIEFNKTYKIGGFTIIPFEVEHDAPDTMGFIIEHVDMGKILFLTDTYYCKHDFSKFAFDHIIIECNYATDIIESKYTGDKTYLKNRIFSAHLSLENCKNLLKHLDLSNCKNIVLIHLSDSNSDEKRFVKEVIETTGVPTYAAVPNLILEFSNNDEPNF
jgi:phosphoribosyl 1,2-cyclic phosphodiesterase